MQIFKVNENIEIKCQSKSNSVGFVHIATLFINGIRKASSRCQYYNRTWERYTYASVLSQLSHNRNLASDDKKIIDEFLSNQ